MKLPISWLKEFINTEASVEEISSALVGVGFEVEDVIKYGEGISGVVVGKITDIKRHPDADKLQICTLDIGSGTRTIVTGAKNVKVGDVVPVALDGAKLPSGKTIVGAPLRGVMSEGMLCSGGELNISEAFVDGASVDGILILSGDLPLGENIVKALELDETVLDVSITANRPDCQSILGICRELAAALNASVVVPAETMISGWKPLKFTQPSFEYTVHDVDVRAPKVSVTSSDCPAYTSAVISDIKIEKSPKWMQRRLFMSGINPINNVVDITNYVLLEIGQPLHAFDLDMLGGDINVRFARSGEKIVVLNDTEYTLDGDMTVICDDDKPLAIAGVMGGKYSGISDKTKAVFLESARFARGSVRTTSLRLGLKSDSSIRFERGVDYFGVEYGRRRALALFEQLGAGKVVLDRPLDNRQPLVVNASIDEINSLIGIEIPKKNMVDILTSLGMDVEVDCRNLIVTVPAFREDIDNYTDLAEEIIRFYGYDKLGETFMPTSSVTIGGLSEKQKRIEEIKDLLCAMGAYEIMTYSFTEERVFDKLGLSKTDLRRDAIKIINPISEELSIMKTELVSGMATVLATNITRKNDNFALFELARIYEGKAENELPSESNVLCVGMTGKEDFYSIKSVFSKVLERFNVEYELVRTTEPYLHPGMGADIIVGGKAIGAFGKFHPLAAKNFGIKRDVYIGYLNCEPLLTAKVGNAKYTPLPKLPPVERDLAIVVKEDVTAKEILDNVNGSINGEKSEYLGEAELFDIYRGASIEPGHKSVALKIRLTPLEKTFVDKKIVEIMDKVTTSLGELGAKVRE